MEFSRPDNSLQYHLTAKSFFSKRKLVITFLSAFLILFSILSLLLLRSILNTPTVYHGVIVGGKDGGGYTQKELSSYLEEQYTQVFEDVTLTLFSDRFERNITVSELGIKVDIGAMTQKAYGIAREGSIIERLSKIGRMRIKPISIDLVLDFDTEAFNSLLDKTCQAVYQEIVPSNIVILEDQVILCTGISGQEADRERLKVNIIKAVQASEPTPISVPILEKLPSAIDVETTLTTLNQDPVNAQFVKTSRTTYEIKTHQMGRRIDRDKLMEIVSYVESRENKEYEEIPLPVEFIYPALTEESLKAQLFRDTLASYSTHFRTDSENNLNRSINIGLAAKSIDGTLLLPDEEFSFNKIVGSRTPGKGYKIAHIFADGQIIDGTGGGVCQVSTTLYNAVLRANLAVSERHNHMFTVGYVPLGMDAAVSYGYADLVFKNTTDYPLLINAFVSSDENLIFKIRSTNDYPDLKVKLATKIIRTIPVTVQYIDDPSLPQGTAMVTENGVDGFVVDTYMKVMNGDVLIREEKLHRSVYQMRPKKIIRGTSPVFEMIE